MGCQLARHLIELMRVQLLQDARHLKVEQTAAHRAERGVSDLTNFVVAKVIALPALTYNSSLPQLIQRLDDQFLIGLAGSCQHREREGAANRSRNLGQLARA